MDRLWSSFPFTGGKPFGGYPIFDPQPNHEGRACCPAQGSPTPKPWREDRRPAEEVHQLLFSAAEQDWQSDGKRFRFVEKARRATSLH